MEENLPAKQSKPMEAHWRAMRFAFFSLVVVWSNVNDNDNDDDYDYGYDYDYNVTLTVAKLIRASCLSHLFVHYFFNIIISVLEDRRL